MYNQRISREKFREYLMRVKERVTIKQVLDSYNIYPCKENPNKYHCCFHGKDDIASVSIKTGLYICFTCKKRLDCVGFVKEYEHCSMMKAISILNTKFNLGLFEPLSQKAQEEYKIKVQLREREKAEEERIEQQKTLALSELSKWLQFYEQVIKDTKISIEQYFNGNWKTARFYFKSIKQYKFLEWCFDVINGIYKKDCDEFESIYGAEPNKITEKILKGEFIL